MVVLYEVYDQRSYVIVNHFSDENRDTFINNYVDWLLKSKEKQDRAKLCTSKLRKHALNILHTPIHDMLPHPLHYWNIQVYSDFS